jgi:hypothetical protein
LHTYHYCSQLRHNNNLPQLPRDVVLAAQQLAGARSLELRLGEHLAAYAKQKREAILLAQEAGDVERTEREKLRQRLDWLEEAVDWHPEKGYALYFVYSFCALVASLYAHMHVPTFAAVGYSSAFCHC